MSEKIKNFLEDFTKALLVFCGFLFAFVSPLLYAERLGDLPFVALAFWVVSLSLYLYVVHKYFFGKMRINIAVVFALLVFFGGLMFIVIGPLNQATDSQPGAWHNIRVKGNLSSIRIQTALYEDNHGGYASSSIPVSPCYSSNYYQNSMFEDRGIRNAISSIKEYVSEDKIICALTVAPQSFAVSAPLYQKDAYWCVDSTGFAGQIDAPITKAACK